MKTDTIAVTATDVSNSRVGTVRVSGEEAFSVIDSIFRNREGERVSLNLAQSHTVHYGYICDRDERVDEALVIIMKRPHSYTAKDTVEIDCREGVLMIRRILETVLHAEARTAEPGEFTKRAFLNGRLDLSRAEAVADMAHTTNEHALKSSVNQLNGLVSNKIKELHNQMLYQIAFIELALDDPEHISLDEYGSQLMDALAPVIDEARKLLLPADDGRFTSEGIRAVMLDELSTGEPSLMNVPLGEERVIITEVAKTTRDTLEEYIYLQGTSLNVADTARIRDTEDVVEKIGADRALKAARDVDLVIYMVDGSRPLGESDREIMNFIHDRKITILLNKSDLDLEVGTEELGQLCGHKVIPVSAKKEQGIELLEQEVKKLFYHGDLSFNDQVYITNAHHKEALEQRLESLLMIKGSAEDGMPENSYSTDLMNAYEQLGFIIRESVGGDIVNEIFIKFYAGK